MTNPKPAPSDLFPTNLIEDALKERFGERCAAFDPACIGCLAWAELYALKGAAALSDDTHRCFICNEPFQAGQMVLTDVTEGLSHRECFGEDREAYVKDTDTGEPLGPDDPIPAGEPYDPADYAEPAGSACLCHRCQKKVEYDLIVPDDVWAGISPQPVEGWKGGGILCPECIVAALTHPSPTHRHKKRGSEYVLIGMGTMQAEDWYRPFKLSEGGDEHQIPVDMDEIAIYRDVKDGSLWARPREEFEDGRFEAIPIPEAPNDGH